MKCHNIEDVPRMADLTLSRPKDQWWMFMRDIDTVLSKPGPKEILRRGARWSA